MDLVVALFNFSVVPFVLLALYVDDVSQSLGHYVLFQVDRCEFSSLAHHVVDLRGCHVRNIVVRQV